MTVPKTGSDGFDQNRTPVPPITILQGVGAMFEGKKKKTLPYTRGEIVALCIIKYYLEPREREKKTRPAGAGTSCANGENGKENKRRKNHAKHQRFGGLEKKMSSLHRYTIFFFGVITPMLPSILIRLY